ncbi:MAG: tubulin-like doman-containing protein [Pirellulaceae bacterium]
MQAVRTNEPIPGYTIRERIGAGGYGEVWKADAPGGLCKAIKFVYGYLDEDRASRELKALNRIKAVRHPFLLSLERIEVVEGQLVIVTELADGSLKDCFERFRADSNPGIPRGQLVDFLRDAADALDYMSDQHSLQHLDVKPENLLMVGGRVKVADFGLVKELQDVTCSLMGGLTPLYAPPESFDGQPCHRSDQYSLAIVYQEMLTGVMPFPGTSAAQLAAQHLHSRPRLNALPESDQPIIGRALSKSPDDRFPSCRAMIDALCASRSSGAVVGGDATLVSPQFASMDTPTGADHGTSVGSTFEGAQGPADTLDASSASAAPRRSSRPQARVKVSIPQLNPEPRIVALSSAPIHRESIRLRPTVLLGVGGTAGQTFVRLRQLMFDRFGGMQNLPALRMLLLDTDTRALMRTTQGEDEIAIPPRDTLSLPLRKPQDYRNRSSKLLKTISRRWLYNIPRSLLTEGLRPLGRLALIDHLPDVEQRLEAVLAEAMSPESRATTAERTGLEMSEEGLRVVVVASVSGGSGSGMILDLADAVRKTCRASGVESPEVVGMLTHSTSRNPSARDLAVVNTYAFLHEWRNRNLAPAPAANESQGPPVEPTFDDLHLLHLGDELDDASMAASVDALARRLYLETASPAVAFFDYCRKEGDVGDPGAEPTLKSCGLYRVGNSADTDLPQAVEYLSRRIVDRWLGNEADTSAAGKLPDDDEVDRLTSELAAGMGLDADSLIKDSLAVVEKQFDGDVESVLTRTLAEAAPPEATIDENLLLARRGEILELLAKQFDPHGPDSVRTMSALAAHFNARTEKHAAAIDAWVVQLFDGARTRTRGALRGAEWMAAHLRGLQDHVQQIQKRLDAQRPQLDAAIQNFKPQTTRKPAATEPNIGQLLVQYVRLQFYIMAAHGARGALRALLQRLGGAIGSVKELRQELMAAASEFERVEFDEPSEPDGWSAVSPEEGAMKALRQRSAEIIARIDRHMRDEFFAPQGGMIAAMSSLRATLPNALRNVVRKAVRAAQSRGDAIERMLDGDSEHASSGPNLRDALASATPKLLECGGAKRLLAVLPYGCNPLPLQDAMEREFGETPTVVMDGAEEAIFCYEVEQLAVNHVAAALLDERRDLAEVASRVHTRSDVEWREWGKS